MLYQDSPLYRVEDITKLDGKADSNSSVEWVVLHYLSCVFNSLREDCGVKHDDDSKLRTYEEKIQEAQLYPFLKFFSKSFYTEGDRDAGDMYGENRLAIKVTFGVKGDFNVQDSLVIGLVERNDKWVVQDDIQDNVLNNIEGLLKQIGY